MAKDKDRPSLRSNSQLMHLDGWFTGRVNRSRNMVRIERIERMIWRNYFQDWHWWRVSIGDRNDHIDCVRKLFLLDKPSAQPSNTFACAQWSESNANEWAKRENLKIIHLIIQCSEKCSWLCWLLEARSIVHLTGSHQECYCGCRWPGVLLWPPTTIDSWLLLTTYNHTDYYWPLSTGIKQRAVGQLSISLLVCW